MNKRGFTAAALLMLAACGSSSSTSSETTASATASQTATTVSAPKCVGSFTDGKIPADELVTGGSTRCIDPDGTLRVSGATRCADGRHLASVDARSGAPEGWWLTGEVFHATSGPVAADPGYSAAYKAC